VNRIKLSASLDRRNAERQGIIRSLDLGRTGAG